MSTSTFDPRATALSLPNARLLGQAAAVAYDSAEACKQWATDNGLHASFPFSQRDYFTQTDIQGFVAHNDEIVVVAFRGTEPPQLLDWLTDTKAPLVPWAHPAGKVHMAFYGSLEVIWAKQIQEVEVLPKLLVDRGQRTVWITGHSLGGALAQMCAARSFFVHKIPVQGVYTFGQPRVGDQEFAAEMQAALGSRTFRFVNDHDIVPRVPFFGLGYRHFGGEVFFDHDGRREVRAPAVETLAAALRSGRASINTDLLSTGAKLLTNPLDAEKAAVGDLATALGGMGGNVTDHYMATGYLPFLERT